MRNTSIVTSLFEQGITIAAGTTVSWTNDEGLQHTVTSTDLSVESPYLSAGDSWSHTFGAAGRYSFWCRLHQQMTTTVVVQ